MTQLALDFTEAAPEIEPHEVDALILSLYRARKWMTAAELGARTDQDRRHLRSTASASGGHVISGQKGYKLNFLSTADEIEKSAGWLEHQSNDMKRRAVEQRRVRHLNLKPACLQGILR